jgi:hypothetical protein
MRSLIIWIHWDDDDDFLDDSPVPGVQEMERDPEEFRLVMNPMIVVRNDLAGGDMLPDLEGLSVDRTALSELIRERESTGDCAISSWSPDRQVYDYVASALMRDFAALEPRASASYGDPEDTSPHALFAWFQRGRRHNRPH